MSVKRKKSILVRVAVIGLSAYFLISLGGLFRTLEQNQQQLNEVNQEIETTKQDISAYQELLKEGNESRIIEKAARERLNFVYADELIYIDVSAE